MAKLPLWKFFKVNTMKKLFFLSFFLMVASLEVAAQKYGHLNFGNLISEIPETEAADKELEAYQKQLVAKGEEMAAAFQQNYTKLLQDVQNGTLSPQEQQTKEAELQKTQQSILQYEQEVIQKVNVKRDELLKPIVEKAQQAINDVAKEGGYLLIFDTSIFNAVLFAQESQDVMSQVKAKLGIN